MASSSVPAAGLTAAKLRSVRLSQTAGYLLAFVALGMSSASLGPTLPGLALQTGSSLSEISYLFSARALGYLVGSLVSGRLYDRLPGMRVMAGVLALMAVALFFIPAISLLAILVVAMLLLGTGEGAADVGGNALIVWTHGKRVGPYMNALHFCFGFGAFVAPIVVAQAILHTGGITWAYRLLAILVLPALVWQLRTPSPRASPAEAMGGLKAGRPWAVFLVSALLFFYVAGELSYGGWVYTYALRLGIGSATTAAYLTSAFWGSLMIGRLVAIPLAARFSPSSILRADLLGALLGLAIVLAGRTSPAVLWAGTLVIGFAMASVFPTVISLASTLMNTTGKVTAWFLVGASLGSMVWPWLIGQLFEPAGAQAVMWLITVAMVMSLVVYTLLMREARREG
jgi:MFS transporter, FHS family, Na+ dependent glucose transporter 1